MSEITEHLQGMVNFFCKDEPQMCPLERFILKHGTDYVGRKRPEGYRKMADKQCFKNSFNLIVEDHDLRYVEGFALPKGLIPTFHAWCLDQDHQVIDCTWSDSANASYRGVVIPRVIVVREALRHSAFGVLDYGTGINFAVIEELSKEVPTQSV